MSSPRGDGRSACPVAPPSRAEPPRHRRAALVLSVLTLGLAFVAAAPAQAGGDDLEFARKLTERGYLDLARKVYEQVLDRPGTGPAEREHARYALVLLHRKRFLHASASGASYDRVRDLCDEALAEIHAFARENASSLQGARARLDGAVLRLGFARWVLDGLREHRAGLADADRSRRARADALAAVEQALLAFGALGSADGGDRDQAAYYRAVALHIGARLQPPCSPAAREGLRAAAEALEHFVMTHDGQLLAVHAQHRYGLVWTDLARCAEDPAERHAHLERAMEWFRTCIQAKGHGPDELRIIARAYTSMAKLAQDAEPSAERDYGRDVLLHLDAMLDRHPDLVTLDDGLRAMLAHARLLARKGLVQRALELASQVADRVDAEERETLHRASYRFLVDLARGGRQALRHCDIPPEMLRRIANDQFMCAHYEAAMRVYRRILERTEATPEDFLAWRWHAWERIARCYKQLGDRLGEALAYEPIHEAWMRGWVPHDEKDERDAHMYRAGNDRRAAQVAYAEVHDVTGGAPFDARAAAIARGFRRDYPTHPSNTMPGDPIGPRWSDVLRAVNEKPQGWEDTLRDAYRYFVARSIQENGTNKSRAWVCRIRVRRFLGELQESVEEVDLAWSWWRSESAREEAAQYPSVRLRRKRAKGASLYWKARSQHELGRHAEALAALEGWHATYPDLRSPYPQLGYELLVEANLAADRPEAADAAYRKLVACHPDHVRLGTVAFLLAEDVCRRCEPLRRDLLAAEQAWDAARREAHEQKEERLRLESLLADLDERIGSLEELRKAQPLFRDPESIERKIAAIRARIREVVAELAAHDDRAPAGPETVRRLLRVKEVLAARLHDVLVRAAAYGADGLSAREARGQSVGPQDLLFVAWVHWTLAHLRPEVTAHWETCRRLYERFLELDEVEARPATDPEVRLANERLGIALVRIAQALK